MLSGCLSNWVTIIYILKDYHGTARQIANFVTNEIVFFVNSERTLMLVLSKYILRKAY